MTNIKKVLMTLIFGVLIILLGTTISNASLYLDNLNFDVKLNEDGSMNVTEIWNIDISDTNTLYKTFERNPSKYSKIDNVVVTDITNSTSPKTFTKIDTEMYHVTKGCYYGLINSKNMYEIAWGVSIDSSTEKTYKIDYKVYDVITTYNDCSELYWQFIGSDFEIEANNVEGTIKIPNGITSKEQLKVWAHGQLNGSINIIDEATVKFELEDFNLGKYLEVRIATPNSIFPLNAKVFNINKLESILAEETVWAEEANRERASIERGYKIFATIIIIAIILITIFSIKKVIKYKKILKENKKLEPEIKSEYFRDIPNKNSTVGEASYLYYFKMSMQPAISKIISATLLDLCMKKYITFDIVEKRFGRKEVNIKVLEPTNLVPLKEDEKLIYTLLIKIKNKTMESENDDTFTMKQFEKYIKDNPTGFLGMLEEFKENSKQEQIEEGNYDKEIGDKGSSWIGKVTLYIVSLVFIIIGLFIGLILINDMWSIPVIINILLVVLPTIPTVININLCSKIADILNGLTQKGVNEKEQWEGLKRYMENFSMLDDKEIPALILWEKYLVYATAFGISEKVLKQLKLKYPEIENSEILTNSSYMYLMYNNNLNTNFINSINTSISRGYTMVNSSSGGGRRRRIFRRRRPAEAEAGGRRRKIRTF